MILYFSGTGNSQLTAKQIAEITGDQMISINHRLKEGKKETFFSEHPLVFVVPTYSWRIPAVVERWILETCFTGNRNAYFVLTCGGDCGNAGAYVQKLCVKKGMLFYGIAAVVMPENYLAMFTTPSGPECQNIIEKAKPLISSLAMRIQKGERFPEASVSLCGKLESGPVNRLFYPLFVGDKGFTVSDECVSCGKCAQRCPLNNIDYVDKKPIWKGNCTHCMACIAGCPTEAIEYKNKSKGQHRHYIMEE